MDLEKHKTYVLFPANISFLWRMRIFTNYDQIILYFPKEIKITNTEKLRASAKTELYKNSFRVRRGTVY